MSTKKHTEHPHLTGEHRWGDRGQLILLVLFLGIWITDSFLFHYSTSLLEEVSNYIRVPVAGLVLIGGWYLGASMITMSIASAAFLLVIITFYIRISRYEESILAEAFGNDYLEYKKKTGMLFPKLLSN